MYSRQWGDASCSPIALEHLVLLEEARLKFVACVVCGAAPGPRIAGDHHVARADCDYGRDVPSVSAVNMVLLRLHCESAHPTSVLCKLCGVGIGAVLIALRLP